jgi:hypothetical protein
MLADVMNELAIFGNWHWLLKILPLSAYNFAVGLSG